MTTSIHDSEIAGLQIVMRSTLASIDAALDRGDQRAFRTWCRKRASVVARLESLLLALATTP